jgi:hypothetical protein
LTRVSVSLNDADSITHNGQPLDWERLTDEDDRDYREEVMRYGVVEYNGNKYEIDYIDDPSNYSQNQDGDEYGDGPQIHLSHVEDMGPGKIKEIVGKLKEYLAKKKALKKSVKEETNINDTDTTTISTKEKEKKSHTVYNKKTGKKLKRIPQDNKTEIDKAIKDGVNYETF